MSKRTESVRKGTRISCFAPDARVVFVAGSFNEWNPQVTPLIGDGDGTWDVELPLLPGRYEFKFVVDGCWCCEPGKADALCDGPDVVPNVFGTRNRVVDVT